MPVSGDAGGANALTIFWSDTEGGAATIIVTPGGQVLVADAGWPGARDPDRIVKILTQIGAKKIDYMIVTHYHTDHVGGVIDLAGKIPITTFVDHGPSVEAGADAAYATLAAGKRMTVKPGDTLPLTGVELTFVISHAEPLSRPLPGAGAPNPLCANAVMRAKVPSDENSRSVGFVLRQGKFGFLDLGDLLWGNEHELACPTNNLGQIDLFQVTHHGFAISNAPQLVHAIEPVVAVSNNGASKGGAAATFDVLMRAPMPMDVWQLHRSGSASAAQNAPADRIANDGAPDQGFWIKAVVEPSGRFTVTNGRNGFSKTYESR